MPNYLHRTSLAHLKSIASADLPESLANYIEYPDISAVEGWDIRYWIITGDVISLMDAAARAAVDAQVLSDARDSITDEIDLVESLVRALALVLLDEINTLRAEHSLAARTTAQVKTAIRNKLGN